MSFGLPKVGGGAGPGQGQKEQGAAQQAGSHRSDDTNTDININTNTTTIQVCWPRLDRPLHPVQEGGGCQIHNTICTPDLLQVLHEMKRQGHVVVAAA